MSTTLYPARRLPGLVTVASCLVLLAACAVVPQPLTEAETAARVAADRQAMFAGQDPLTGPLTLDEALRRVLTNNLDRRAKMMEEALALGQLQLDRYDLLPELAASAGYDGRSKPDASVSRDLVTQANTAGNPTYSRDRDTITADLGLTWNVLDFGVSYYNAQQNADRALIAQERRRKAVQNLVQEVRAAFWRAAAAQVLKSRVAVTIDNAERALADSERVESEQLRNPVDVLRVQKALLESMRQLEAINQDLQTAKSELAALINVPPGSDFTLAIPEAMPLPAIDLPIERMEELALSNNPDLREQDYQTRIVADETRKELLKLLPGLNLSLSRQWDSNSFNTYSAWNEAGARVSWNLFNLLSAPDRIDFAETREKVNDAKRLALRMAVLAQVHVVSSQVDSAGRQFLRADKLAQVERRLAAASLQQQQGGTRNAVDAVTQETSAIAAELRRYQTYAVVQAAFGKLQATLGQDLSPDLGMTSSLAQAASPTAAR